MCFTLASVRTAGPWNWDGDEIIHRPVIEGPRKIPGTELEYPIDIRSFLLTRDNAVIREALELMLGRLSASEQVFFHSSRVGAFDYRVRVVLEFVSREIRYIPGIRSFDHWLFPDETLRQRGGDCEDRAFLLAALMLASGVSGYALRVVLGKLFDESADRSRDHVWVMYRNEAGRWMCLEPLLLTRQARRSVASRHGASHSTRPRGRARDAAASTQHVYEYIPYYAFNDTHLWHIRSNVRTYTRFHDFIEARCFWTHFNPEFATGVHNQILDDAVPDMPWADLQYAKAVSIAMDANAPSYDPREHFDNGYIKEGWRLARKRLESGSLTGFAQAAHAIADFYAHSSYACFAHATDEGLELFDGSLPVDYRARFAEEPFNLHDAARFSVNPHYYTDPWNRDLAVRTCTRKRIISGRYAQTQDPSQSFLERVFVSIPYVLRKAPDFPPRGCFPHHDEMAVDAPPDNGVIPSAHRLYTHVSDYERQFLLRKDAATRQIRMWWEMAGNVKRGT